MSPSWRQKNYRYWEHDDPIHGAPAHYGVRSRDHKLIYCYGAGLGVPGASERHLDPEWELYDLRNDPPEVRNVADDPAYSEIKPKWSRSSPSTRGGMLMNRIAARPHPVPSGRPTTFEPNAYGLWQTIGNVWEWCADWWHPGYYLIPPLLILAGREEGRSASCGAARTCATTLIATGTGTRPGPRTRRTRPGATEGSAPSNAVWTAAASLPASRRRLTNKRS